MIEQVTDKIINGYEITKEEAMLLYELPVEELVKQANQLRIVFCGESFDLCTIINGKSGECSEDCKYCAQSGHYHTKSEVFPLRKEEIIVNDAIINEKKGVGRYSIVTSGKRASEKEVDKICSIYQSIREKSLIKLCASLGLLGYESLLKLKAAGVVRYHNNLETSRRFFPSICTTHTYDEKIQTIKAAQRSGLEVCCGGIIGLGETVEDRIDMAFELKALKIQSIPLNLLNAIEGTPLAGVEKVTQEEFIKIASIYRFIHPHAVIRLAGGRNLLTDFGRELFASGVNGTITGELLTTYGNDTDSDVKMIRKLGYRV
ncbi:biotin synthase BioB [Gottschalkiaceae bacterium SANA]|nr:biotin synthase BioB [Gottschalkiaceae bacterium SANA]